MTRQTHQARTDRDPATTGQPRDANDTAAGTDRPGGQVQGDPPADNDTQSKETKPERRDDRR